VTVSKGDTGAGEARKNLVPARFSDPGRSVLRIDVPAQGKETANFVNLTSS